VKQVRHPTARHSDMTIQKHFSAEVTVHGRQAKKNVNMTTVGSHIGQNNNTGS